MSLKRIVGNVAKNIMVIQINDYVQNVQHNELAVRLLNSNFIRKTLYSEKFLLEVVTLLRVSLVAIVY